MRTAARFDDGNLVSRAGLVPVMALAERAGLRALAYDHLRVGGPCGASAPVKVACLVAGMAAGADSIEDMDVLAHGAMTALFAGLRAPSTLGSFLRAFTWGGALQLGMVNRLLLVELARRAPVLPAAGVLAFVDIDSTHKRVFGYKKQGAGFGHTKIAGKTVLVRGLNALAATICAPQGAPVIAGVRLRGGRANSARGAAGFAAAAVATARQAGCTGVLVTRMDSGFYSGKVIAAIGRAGAFFSVTARMSPRMRTVIAAISDDAWTPVRYPHAIFDDQLKTWVSDAEVAETTYIAFAGSSNEVTARLIVRRVRDKNRGSQGELFPVWRYHAVLTDSPFTTVQAEAQHRGHAIIEQVFADLAAGPLAHMPSGSFPANAAWLALAAITHNLLRAAGSLASAFHAKARTATLREHLINVAARTARHGRGHLTLHMPRHWPWQDAWTALFETACGPPRKTA